MISNNLTEGNGQKRQGRLTRWLSPSLLALAVIAFMGMAAPAAKADDFTYNFSLTDTSNIINIAFSLPSTFTPASFTDGQYFQTDPISYTVNGTTETPLPVSFWNTSQGGGMIIGDVNGSDELILNQGGSQLYTGDESDPTGFVFGTYSLTNWGGAVMNDNFTLTITDPPSLPTPEPSSLLLLGAGMLALSGLIAYQQKKQGQLITEGASNESI